MTKKFPDDDRGDWDQLSRSTKIQILVINGLAGLVLACLFGYIIYDAM